MPKNGLYKPPKTEQEQKMAAGALATLLAHDLFQGNKNKMASELGFTRNAVSFWFSKGYMGHQAAVKIAERKDLPFGLNDLRPDIHARISAKTAELEKIQPPLAEGKLAS